MGERLDDWWQKMKTPRTADTHGEETKARAEAKWYASGRGIFHREAGFQLGTMVASANWQEETARFVDLLNKGEELDDTRADLAIRNARQDVTDAACAALAAERDAARAERDAAVVWAAGLQTELAQTVEQASERIEQERTRAATAEARRPCPCQHITPCRPDCSCVAPFSSAGCRRCCSYGSQEQQRSMAEHLATAEAQAEAMRKALERAYDVLDEIFDGPPETWGVWFERSKDVYDEDARAALLAATSPGKAGETPNRWPVDSMGLCSKCGQEPHDGAC